MRFSFCIAVLLFIVSCKPTYKVGKTDSTVYVLSDSAHAGIDSSFYLLLKPYRDKMQQEMSVVLASSETEMEKGVPESRLGNYVSDACMFEANRIADSIGLGRPDFAFFNNGGLRRSLPKGKITRGDVFELMPFENELVILYADGKMIRKLLNFIASKRGAPVSGIRFVIKNAEATDVVINGKQLDTLASYRFLTSDYLANGGDSFEFLTALPREKVNIKMRDAIMNFLQRAGNESRIVNVNTDGRVRNAE